MTLWPAADEDTAKLMVDFYSAAHESGNAPQALAEVQRDWLALFPWSLIIGLANELKHSYQLDERGMPLAGN